VFGSLRAGSVELSNVDLAREFSELIVVQRGYQASSQVISAANEMIQQLGEIRGRR
jgi:flagellar hook protein FlgE